MELELFDDNLAKEKIENYNISSTCAICLDSMTKENNYCILECKHEFHSSCLVNWFRTGKKSCPMCRNEGETCNHHRSNNTLFKMKIKYGLKNINAPKEFKKIVNKYIKLKEKVKTLEKERKEVNKEMKELKKEEDNLTYKDFIDLRGKLYTNSHKLFKKIRKYQRETYELEKTIESIPVKPIFLLKKKVERK